MTAMIHDRALGLRPLLLAMVLCAVTVVASSTRSFAQLPSKSAPGSNVGVASVFSGRLVRAGSIAIGPGPLKSLQLNAQIFQGLLQRRQSIVGDRHSGRAQPVPQPGARGGMLQQAIQELGRR
jgi:hypothetical protein